MSMILCFAPDDHVIVAFFADFLNANVAGPVSTTEAVVSGPLDLIDATERALSADVALVFLSRASVPKVWPDRNRWESVFVHQAKEFQTHLGFVLVGSCDFPSGLRKHHFFDALAHPLTAARDIKRWLLQPEERTNSKPPLPSADIETLRRAIADRPASVPGIAPDAAQQFATDCSDEFEAVYRFDCSGRSRAGIMGDIGSALGLRMSGKLEQNRAALTRWGADRRVLFLLAGVGDEDHEFAAPGGLTSTIFTTNVTGAIPSRISLPLLRAQERYAEMLELLDAMAETARSRGDRHALLSIDWERYWVCDKLDIDEAPGIDAPGMDRAAEPEPGIQLLLPFAE